MLRPACCLLVILVATAPAWGEDAVELNDAELAFVELMTNATMVGHFSIDGQETPAKTERYEISKAQKLGGSKWLITARIKYGQNDIEVPVAVDMNWAGDTPVLSVTDIRIPGLGEGFTTRLMFYRNRYAGSWYHGEAGGHMWGTIESAEQGDDVSELELTPEQRQILKRLDQRLKAVFVQTPLKDAVAYLTIAGDVGISFSDDVPAREREQPVDFQPLGPVRLGHLLPRMLPRYGLAAYVVDNGVEIRPAGSRGVPAVSPLEDPRVQQALENKVPTEFVNCPLKDAAAFIRDVVQVDVEIAPGINGDLPITFNGEGLKASDVLDLMLWDFGLEAHVALDRVLIRPKGDELTEAHVEMGKQTEFEFSEAPLSEVADYFSKLHDIPVTLDPAVNAELPMTGRGKGLLYPMLSGLLKPHNLVPVVKDRGIYIQVTSAE